MKPKLIHQEAMEYSFKAKHALAEGDKDMAFDYYTKAAELESLVAEFYFDKPELEPTRSVLIRSAAFLNLKAGLVGNAQKFIFFGLLNIKDELIRNQLNNALEFAVSMNNLSPNAAREEMHYLSLLRLRSINYVIEPSNVVFGHSVSLEMIKEFSESYLKSLKAYAISKFKKVSQMQGEIEDDVKKEIEKLINPLITNSAYGSFKFSVANDFLERVGEKKDVVDLKKNVIINYHNEIFINPLTDEDISIIKNTYSTDEINEIFRPLAKIKSANSTYKIGYYDSDNFNKIYPSRIVNKQKTKLITVNQISKEDIGELESSIVHKRSSSTGSISKKTIFKEQLKSLEVDITSNQIELKDHAPVMLNQDILITMNFDSSKGFTFTFNDFKIEYTDIEHEKALSGFYLSFYNKIILLANISDKNEEQEKDWDVVKNLIGNPETFIVK